MKKVAVKITAYVDENIKELIEILNAFDGIQTLESSGGDEGWPARIFIECGTNYDEDSPEFLEYDRHKIADVAQFFSDVFKVSSYSEHFDPLWEVIHDSDIDVSIRWRNDSMLTYNPYPSPVIIIEFPYKHIGNITKVLSYIQSELLSEHK
jgi:hypothetical protein